MVLLNEIKVPQAVIFDQETETIKKENSDQTGTQANATIVFSLYPVIYFSFR